MLRLARSHLVISLACAAALAACSDDSTSDGADGTSGDGGGTSGDGGTQSGTGDDGGTTGGTGSGGTDGTGTGGGDCGNGEVDGAEECDDGNMDADDGCENDCTVTPGTAWWTISHDETGRRDSANDVVVDTNDDVIVAGFVTTEDQGQNAWIRRVDTHGDEIWTQTHDGPMSSTDRANGVALDGAGNIVVVGSETVAMDDTRIWIRKLDPDGAELWTQLVDTPGEDDSANDVAVTSDDVIVVVGSVGGDTEGDEIWVGAFDADGNAGWTDTHTGPNMRGDAALGVAVDSQDAAIVVGYQDVDGEEDDIWIRKYDSSGTEVWTKNVQGDRGDIDRASGVAVDDSDNVVVIGLLFSMTGSGDLWLQAYDAGGSELWDSSWNSDTSFYDEGVALALGADGTIHAVGGTDVINQQRNILMGTFDATGQELDVATHNGNASLEDFGLGVAVDSAGDIIYVGAEGVSGEDRNAWIRKVAR